MKEFNINKKINKIEVVTDYTSRTYVYINVIPDNVDEVYTTKDCDISIVGDCIMVKNKPMQDNTISIEISKDMIKNNSLEILSDSYIYVYSSCDDIDYEIKKRNDKVLSETICFKGTANNLNLSTMEDGVVFLKDVHAKTIYARTYKGNIHLRDVNCSCISALSNSGNIFVCDTILDKFTIITCNGNITSKDCIFSRKSCNSFDRKDFITSNGNILIENINCKVFRKYRNKNNLYFNEVNSYKYDLGLHYVNATIVEEYGKITVI
jgi:hypothetical protein